MTQESRDRDLFEEAGSFHVDTHSSKDNGKVILVVIQHTFGGQVDQTGLTTNLSCNFVVRQTSSRENGNLLTSVNSCQFKLVNHLGADSDVSK